MNNLFTLQGLQEYLILLHKTYQHLNEKKRVMSISILCFLDIIIGSPSGTHGGRFIRLLTDDKLPKKIMIISMNISFRNTIDSFTHYKFR